MWLFSQNKVVCNESNVQRFKLFYMNRNFQEIKNSSHDADIKWYR